MSEQSSPIEAAGAWLAVLVAGVAGAFAFIGINVTGNVRGVVGRSASTTRAAALPCRRP